MPPAARAVECSRRARRTPEDGRSGGRDQSDGDDGDRGLLLDLLGVQTAAGPLPSAAAGRTGVRRHTREAASDDGRCGDSHGGRGGKGDRSKGQGEPNAQAHGRAAR